LKIEAEIRAYLEDLIKKEAELNQLINNAKDEETRERLFQQRMYIQRQRETLEWVLDEYPRHEGN
jgi:hypothetical protein